MEPQPNDFWYTPPVILEAVKMVLGADYFDPCPVNPVFNGLNTTWGHKCFINPPYSKKLKREFIRKAKAEFKTLGNSYIWLMNYGNSKDLQDLKSKASVVCLPHQRIKFIPGKLELGGGGSPRYDNIILMWGGDVQKFQQAFTHIGTCFATLDSSTQVAP